MSGGSLNYLCYKEPKQLFDHIDDMEEVEFVLLRAGYADIAKDVRRLIEYVKTAENRISVLRDKLENVFHAVEWYCSADYSRDSLIAAFDLYREEQI